jgi:hypothetical protein
MSTSPPCLNTPVEMPVLSQTLKSIYIPRVHVSYGYNEVVTAFNQIAHVYRVDFVPLKHTEGNVADYFMSAFVYIAEWNLSNPFTHEIITNIQDKNKQNRFKFHPFGLPHYWMLYVNHKPIADTNQNIHQLSECCRTLFDKVEEQTVLNRELSDRVEKLTEFVRSMSPTPPHQIEWSNDGLEDDIIVDDSTLIDVPQLLLLPSNFVCQKPLNDIISEIKSFVQNILSGSRVRFSKSQCIFEIQTPSAISLNIYVYKSISQKIDKKTVEVQRMFGERSAFNEIFQKIKSELTGSPMEEDTVKIYDTMNFPPLVNVNDDV